MLSGALIVGAASLWAYAHHAGPTKAAVPQVAYWKTQIAALGGKAAYEEFAKEYGSKDANTGHLAAHYFGQALYEEEGEKGISVCDDRFIYGCFHQFTAEVIAAKGLDALQKLGVLCAKNQQCLHGAGHGVLAYLGYDAKSLEEALAKCRALPDNSHFSGCESGAIMEYDLRNAIPGTNFRMIPATTTNPYEPCDMLEGDDAGTCFYWQPQIWKLSWMRAFATSTLAAKMGRLCTALEEPNRSFCMGGVGAAEVPEAAYDPAKLGTLCDTASAALHDRAVCRAAGGKALLGSLPLEKSRETCVALPQKEAQECRSYLSTPSTPGTFGTIATQP